MLKPKEMGGLLGTGAHAGSYSYNVLVGCHTRAAETRGGIKQVGRGYSMTSISRSERALSDRMVWRPESDRRLHVVCTYSVHKVPFGIGCSRWSRYGVGKVTTRMRFVQEASPTRLPNAEGLTMYCACTMYEVWCRLMTWVVPSHRKYGYSAFSLPLHPFWSPGSSLEYHELAGKIGWNLWKRLAQMYTQARGVCAR